MTGRWRFVSDHRHLYGVQRLCRVLGVSASGFYRWINTGPAREARRAADQALGERIQAIHTESGGAYGVPRITAELRGHGDGPVNHKRVARIMRERMLAGRHLRRTIRTTVPDKTAPPAPDLVGREFTAPAPDVRWCGDITYLPVGSEWMYLATVIDMHSRRVVGWSLAEHMRSDLVTDAIEAAVAARGGDVAGVIFHSDRGSQGGFNWLSQHLVVAEVFGGSSPATGGPGDSPGDEVAWSSEVPARGRVCVLGGDRQGVVAGRGSRRDRIRGATRAEDDISNARTLLLTARTAQCSSAPLES